MTTSRSFGGLLDVIVDDHLVCRIKHAVRACTCSHLYARVCLRSLCVFLFSHVFACVLVVVVVIDSYACACT